MKRGRPVGTQKKFITDDDRYAVALADTFMAVGISERKAFDLATATFFAHSVPSNKEASPLRLVSNWAWFSFEMNSQMVGFGSKASTLRKKAHRALSDADVSWRAAMVLAMYTTLFDDQHSMDQRIGTVRLACRSINENEYAEACLVPALMPE